MAKSDFYRALKLLEHFVARDQLHTRKGSYVGRQEPLADAAQSAEWNDAKFLLVKYGRTVPEPGTKLDG